jgi:hypothetical protein
LFREEVAYFPVPFVSVSNYSAEPITRGLRLEGSNQDKAWGSFGAPGTFGSPAKKPTNTSELAGLSSEEYGDVEK